MIHAERVKHLNDKPYCDGKLVIYWMQASQREEYNHALEYAIDLANELKMTLVVLFVVTGNFPEANLRHYSFMLEGLLEVKAALAKRGINLIVKTGIPETEVAKFANQAAVVVTDRGYTRIQRLWRRAAAGRLNCRFTEVESDIVVPVETASDKEEYSAATIRKKINRRLDNFLVPVRKRRLRILSKGLAFKSLAIENSDMLLKKLKIDCSVSRTTFFQGGTSEAKKRLRHFLNHGLEVYNENRNDPSMNGQSDLSSYLHFGQISPLHMVLEAKKINSPSVDSFLEELIIRRELAMNFAYYNDNYDNYNCLPDWCRRTLAKHAGDKREYLYSLEQFETARTHDHFWNSAQSEMVITGKMQGYMRMYWGKKILEWSRSPEEAFVTALYLNNKYELDGRDPNGFAGVAWCFGKHDRPWQERPIYGTIRYMSADGLNRKFDMKKYIARVNNLAGFH